MWILWITWCITHFSIKLRLLNVDNFLPNFSLSHPVFCHSFAFSFLFLCNMYSFPFVKCFFSKIIVYYSKKFKKYFHKFSDYSNYSNECLKSIFSYPQYIKKRHDTYYFIDIMTSMHISYHFTYTFDPTLFHIHPLYLQGMVQGLQIPLHRRTSLLPWILLCGQF